MAAQTNYGGGAAKGLDLIHEMSSKLYYGPKTPVDTIQKYFVEQSTIPINGWNGNGPYTVEIGDGGPDAFLDMDSIRQVLKVSLRDLSGNVLPAEDVAAVAAEGDTPGTAAISADTANVVNHLGAAFWKRVECKINGGNFHSITFDNTHYKKVIDGILTYSKAQRETAMQLEMWDDKDEAGKFDQLTDNGNAGFAHRRKKVKGSQVLFLKSRVPCDLFQGDKFLPPGFKVTLIFHPSDVAFLLMGGKKDGNNKYTNNPYKFKIHDFNVSYRRIHVHDGSETALTGVGPVHIISPATELNTFPIPSGELRKQFSVHTSGSIPTQIIFTFIDSEAFSGTREKNPFNFQHFKLKDIQLRVNGRTMPHTPLEMKWDNEFEGWQEAYDNLINNTGFAGSREGNVITPELFREGLFFLPFDLTPDKCNGAHLHDMEQGDIQVYLGWHEPLKQSITMQVYKIYQQKAILYPIDKQPKGIPFDAFTF